MQNGFIELLIFDFLIILIPLLLYFSPPKEINAIYGYRTKRASKDIESWNFAQRYFSKKWILIPLVVIISQIVMIALGITISGEPPLVPIISIIEFLIGSTLCIYSTELELKKLHTTLYKNNSGFSDKKKV